MKCHARFPLVRLAWQVCAAALGLLLAQWVVSSLGRTAWIARDASILVSWSHGSIVIYQADNLRSFIRHDGTGLRFSWNPRIVLESSFEYVYPGRLDIRVNLLWVIAWLAVLAAVFRSLQRFPRRSGLCQDCGYDTRGAANVCTECGRPRSRDAAELPPRLHGARVFKWLGLAAFIALAVSVFGWAAFVGTPHVIPAWTAQALLILMLPTAYAWLLAGRLARVVSSQPAGPL